MLNGVRLGGYQLAEDRHLNLRPDGQISMWRTMVIGAIMGIAGSISGSPLLLVNFVSYLVVCIKFKWFLILNKKTDVQKPMTI